MKYIPYIILLALIMLPIVVVDGLIARIESGGWEFAVRFFFIMFAIQIARLVPAPSN